jgi:hypothetical protein
MDDPIIGHVWITRYALTTGIKKYAKARRDIQRPGMISIGYACYHRPDWHCNAKDALARAEDMRKKKIESLRRQLIKMERKTFTVEP